MLEWLLPLIVTVFVITCLTYNIMLRIFYIRLFQVMLPEREINVYPDDILAIQHTAPPGGFLHCLRSSNSPWRHSYVSLAGPEWGGWIAGGLLAMPTGAQWVDEVVCDLRLLYADAFSGYTTSTMHSTGQSPTHMETAGSLGKDRIYGGAGPTPTPVLGIHLVYPTPDQGGQIHIPVNTPTLFIIKIQSGSNATSSWSAPISQTGIPFLPSCPPGPTESHHGCEKDSADTWFSHAYLALSEPGSHMLNVSASNHISSQSVSVRLQAHQRVRGLTILPHGDQRLLVGAPQVQASASSVVVVHNTFLSKALDVAFIESEIMGINGYKSKLPLECDTFVLIHHFCIPQYVLKLCLKLHSLQCT